MIVKMGIFHQVGVKIKKSLKPPTSLLKHEEQVPHPPRFSIPVRCADLHLLVPPWTRGVGPCCYLTKKTRSNNNNNNNKKNKNKNKKKYTNLSRFSCRHLAFCLWWFLVGGNPNKSSNCLKMIHIWKNGLVSLDTLTHFFAGGLWRKLLHLLIDGLKSG